MTGANYAKTKKKLFGPGTLVRVKNLERFAAFSDGELAYDSIIQERSQYLERTNLLTSHRTFKEFFHSLPLDISPQESYVAEVVHSVYLQNSYIPQWVGVKFYTSLSLQNKPENLWKGSEGRVFYYPFANTLLLHKILVFESLDIGSLFVYGENRSGIVIAKNRSTRKSILTYAWTRHIVHYVTNSLVKQYLYPSKKFTLVDK